MSLQAGQLSAVTASWALLPVALAQFICSFAGSNMNVMLNEMSRDLDTTVQGIQISITLFLLVMAALMIPFGRPFDVVGAVLSALGLIVAPLIAVAIAGIVVASFLPGRAALAAPSEAAATSS